MKVSSVSKQPALTPNKLLPLLYTRIICCLFQFNALVATLLVLQLTLELPTTEAIKRRYPLLSRGLFFKKKYQYQYYQPVVSPHSITPSMTGSRCWKFSTASSNASSVTGPSFENAISVGIATEASSEELGVSSEENETPGLQESSSEEIDMIGSVLRPPNNPVLQHHCQKSLNPPRRIEQQAYHWSLSYEKNSKMHFQSKYT